MGATSLANVGVPSADSAPAWAGIPRTRTTPKTAADGVVARIACTLSSIGAKVCSASQPLSNAGQSRCTSIQQLYARYAHTLDLGDAEGWADTFTPDGVFANSKGRAELITFAEGFYGRGGDARHWNSQVLITPTAEGADGSCYLLLVNTGAQPVSITVSAIYQDKIVKIAAGWRFQERVATVEMPAGSQ